MVLPSRGSAPLSFQRIDVGGEPIDRFERLVRQADARGFSGWDFSFVERRMVSEPVPWDLGARVAELARSASALLDMGTGGGEFLSSLRPLPPVTVATEAWGPNVPVAGERLHPLGIAVVEAEAAPDNVRHTEDGGRLPFLTDAFDVVMNRHEAFDPDEVARVLAPEGAFLTQQVGEDDERDLLERFGVSPARGWTLDTCADQLRSTGLEIVEGAEAHTEKRFADVGAVVYYLKAIPWIVGDFSVTAHRDVLREIHQEAESRGAFTVHEHRFYVEARKPS